jgi:hypothetical protein
MKTDSVELIIYIKTYFIAVALKIVLLTSQISRYKLGKLKMKINN